MVNNGTCGCDQTGGKHQNDSNPDIKTKKEKVADCFIGFTFIFGVVISVIFGFAAHEVKLYGSILIWMGSGIILMFLGMMIIHLKNRSDIDILKGTLLAERAMAEVRLRKRTREVKESTELEMIGFTIEAARAVANRVANRLIARHASQLLVEEYREATLEETDQVVDEAVADFEKELKKKS
jgi:hypothetical protein